MNHLPAPYGENCAWVIDCFHTNGPMIKSWAVPWWWETVITDATLLTGGGVGGWRRRRHRCHCRWHIRRDSRSDVLSRQAKTTANYTKHHQPSAISRTDQLQVDNCATRWFCLFVRRPVSTQGRGGAFHVLPSPRPEWNSGCGPCHPIDLPLYSSPSGVYALNLVCRQGPSLIIDPSVSGGETNADWFQRDRARDRAREREHFRHWMWFLFSSFFSFMGANNLHILFSSCRLGTRIFFHRKCEHHFGSRSIILNFIPYKQTH